MPVVRASRRPVFPGGARASILLLLPLPLFAQGNYSLVPDWPLPARTAAGTTTPWNLIQVPGVAVDSRGHVLVLHRGAHPILDFDTTGKFIRSWGDGMFSEGKVAAVAPRDRAPGACGYSAVYGPAGCDSCGVHSIRIDAVGNIWVVDAPSHVIYKMDPQGKVLLRLGRRGAPGISSTNFNLPTDVERATIRKVDRMPALSRNRSLDHSDLTSKAPSNITRQSVATNQHLRRRCNYSGNRLLN